MKLKLDENLGGMAATLLRRAGFDVRTVPEQVMCSSSDRNLIQKCSNEERCLVTLDMEFGNPLLFRPSDYHGIAVLRLPARPTPENLSNAVRTLIGGLSRENIDGKLWIIQRGKVREYQPENIDNKG